MSKRATVDEASPSPPPLPKEPLPTLASSTSNAESSSSTVVDQPIDSLGDDDESDEDDGEEQEEWDPSEERLPGQDTGANGKRKRDDKGKGKAKDDTLAGVAAADGGQPWQAVWSGEKNGSSPAWYFWNTSTGEVTWTNPLAPPLSTSHSQPGSSSSSAPPLPFGPAPLLNTVQPSRSNAYLLPSESRYLPGTEPGDLQTANFNARSGKFNSNNNDSTFDRLDAYNKEKRFNSHYFDQEKWEADMRELNRKKALEGPGTGKISKKDMYVSEERADEKDRFKKKRQEKRMRSQAWLRD